MRLTAALAAVSAAALTLVCAGPLAAAQLGSLSDADAAPTTIDTATTGGVKDPWEGFNRKMFALNDTFDRSLMVPAAKAYRAVTHKKQRKGIRNFLDNLRTPVILLNDILQGEFKRAGDTTGRFLINSTIGFGGMGDPAERMGVAQHSEDFGQTLAVWGVDSGPFIVMPFFGPTTLRDGFGAGVGLASDPVFWIRTDAAQYFGYARTGVNLLSIREPLIEPLDDIRADSLDYYASIRSFYLQARKREIENGRTNFDDLPDFEEFDEIE